MRLCFLRLWRVRLESATAGAQEIVDIAVGVGGRSVELFTSETFKRRSALRAQAVGCGEVAGEFLQCLLYDCRVSGGVFADSCRNFSASPWPAAEHVGQVVGILGLAAIGEGERLETDECARAADGDCTAYCFAGQGIAIDVDLVAFVEGQLQPRCDERAEVAFQVVDTTAAVCSRDRR